MATKRRPIRSVNNSPNMNFRPGGPDISRSEARGTRPTAQPTTVQEILITTVMYVCKKAIFFDTNLKVALYLGSLFLISLIGDFVPYPKTYLARSDNLFNVYFVKIGWGWTLLLSLPYLVMTSFVLCCGDKKKMLLCHLPRIGIATFYWFFWTKLFNVIETSYGRCTVREYDSKSLCLRAGHLWSGFDISGHAFILIHSSLVLIEEARPIVKWESIKEHLRNEIHNRSVSERCSTNPLRNLSNEQIKTLNILYERLTPAIRTLFIGIVVLQLLWDVMLVGTMLYFHRMIEKVISGGIAILTWYFTYRFWYPSKILPDSPGNGCFHYQRERSEQFIFKRTSSLSHGSSSQRTPATVGQGPMFMGLPIYTNSRLPQTSTTSSSVNYSNEIPS